MTLLRFLSTRARALERRVERGQQQRDDAYLAAAADHADLERRQRELARAPTVIPHCS